ncbi:fusaric acid resistance protein FusB [Neoasaia chiangmaiensis NBRC 101099]|nr:fusaric acid resistance protein FusB [Neoasaia chiangmaiensis NBRC 101099]GEN16278.1 hypothetical protein NCH01_27090 [Neoasaia chiangmaiensis]
MPFLKRFRWLYAPDPVMAGYALRTTCTSLLALGIALWMELGSPQWAALTVWMVAQGTRGRSLAKARWHLFGMVLGVFSAIALVAACPQAPMLFIVLLALGIGSFCLIGTFLPGPATMTNYRIHGMRATGFTYAIISLDGITDPNHIFQIAAARATYIVLGIVLEASVSAIFQLGLARRTRQQLAENFESSLTPALQAISGLLAGKPGAMDNVHALFGNITALSDQVEFAEVELGRHDHAGDHARAALADIAILLARGLDLATLMRVPMSQDDTFHTQAKTIRAFLDGLPSRLRALPGIDPLLDELRTLRHACRAEVVQAFDATTQDGNTQSADLRHGMLQQALVELIDALRTALRQFDASRKPPVHDTFREPLHVYRDWHQAVTNSLRASLTVFGAGVIWVTTAWSDGLAFLMFVSIVCSLFSTLERPALATQSFFRGACCAILAGGILDLGLLGEAGSFEILAMWFGVAMLLGGLAFAHPPLTLSAVSYNLFLPIIVGPSNQGRTDEIIYFNTALPLFLGLFYATWMFRVVLPYDAAQQRWTMRENILRGLRDLAGGQRAATVDDIVARHVDRFVRLMNNAGGTSTPVVTAYLNGILSAMRVALNLLRLGTIARGAALPPGAKRALNMMLARMNHFSGRYGGHYGRTLRATRLAIATLRRNERHEQSPRIRFILIAALASLDIVATELDSNRSFFDARNPFLDPSNRHTPLQDHHAEM